MNNNKSLQQAKACKNNDFYTHLLEIAKEVSNYVKEFDGNILLFVTGNGAVLGNS